MLDVKPTVVNKLKEVIPNVQYEISIESPTLPLITYTTINDSVHAYGDTLGYSDVKYQIKYWTTSIKELSEKMEQIDDKLKSIGLKRTYYIEMTKDDIVIGVSQYAGLVKEQF